MKKTLCLIVCILCLMSLTVNAGVPVGGPNMQKDVISQDYEDTSANGELTAGANVGSSADGSKAAIITATQSGGFYTENAALKETDNKYTINFDVYAKNASAPLKVAFDTGLEKPFGIVIYPGTFLPSGSITKTDLTGKITTWLSDTLDYTTSVPIVSSSSVPQVGKWFTFEVAIDLTRGKENISFADFPEEIISVKFKERGAAEFTELSSSKGKIYSALYGYKVMTDYGGIMPSNYQNVTMAFYAYNNGNGNDDLGTYSTVLSMGKYTSLAKNAEYHIDNVMVNYVVARDAYLLAGHVFGYDFEDSAMPPTQGTREVVTETGGNKILKLTGDSSGTIGAEFLYTGKTNSNPDRPIQIDHKDYSMTFDIYRKSGVANLKFELYENFGREFVESTTDLTVGIDGKKEDALNVLLDGERYDYVLSDDGTTLTKYRRILDIASVTFSDSEKETALPNGAWYTYKIARSDKTDGVKIVRKLRDSENSEWEEIEAEETKGVIHGVATSRTNTVKLWNYSGHSTTDEILIDNFVFGRSTTASVTRSRKTDSLVTAIVHAEDASKIADPDGEVVMVLAVYDEKTGCMIDCDYKTLPADAGYVVAELSAKASSINNIAKVFVWNSMEPKLTEKIVIE